MPHLSAPTLRPSLQNKQGHSVLYVQGSPFEMGFQHGSLLKEKIHYNIEKYLKKPPEATQEQDTNRIKEFIAAIPLITSHIPQKYLEEIRGVSEGASASFEDILLLNLFPEMFHCCGITASHEASKDGSLYHARVLDYSAGKDLQSSAVLVVAKPNQGIPFLNVTYAGFIGSVTGMNEEKISIGEIGGQGYGRWDGIPMSFLLRSILEEAKTLEEAKAILTKAPRTCEYYYVISDGKTQHSFSCYATDSQIEFLSPGEDYSISHPQEKSQDLLIKQGKSSHLDSLFFHQPKDTLLLIGFTAPERYPVLLERTQSHFGKLDEKSLMDIIQRPVSRESNLHNAIFHPASLTIWISHAGLNGEPACTQDYVQFSFDELRRHFL